MPFERPTRNCKGPKASSSPGPLTNQSRRSQWLPRTTRQGSFSRRGHPWPTPESRLVHFQSSCRAALSRCQALICPCSSDWVAECQGETQSLLILILNTCGQRIWDFPPEQRIWDRSQGSWKRDASSVHVLGALVKPDVVTTTIEPIYTFFSPAGLTIQICFHSLSSHPSMS